VNDAVIDEVAEPPAAAEPVNAQITLDVKLNVWVAMIFLR
jgi:hypothetical protein